MRISAKEVKLGRAIKNLTLSAALVGLVGIITGIGLFINGQNASALFYLLAGIILFAISFLVAIYYHDRNVDVERWGVIIGALVLIDLFVLEVIFFSFIFALGVIITALIIIFVYAFVARTIYKKKHKNKKCDCGKEQCDCDKGKCDKCDK